MGIEGLGTIFFCRSFLTGDGIDKDIPIFIDIGHKGKLTIGFLRQAMIYSKDS